MPAKCHLFTIEVSAGPPVDFSFKNLQSLGGPSCGRPRGVRLRKMPCMGCSGRFVTRSMWLNNNCLTNIRGLSGLVSSYIEQPQLLGWLDLSHNFIDDIHPEILHFPQLRILYLHGNLISRVCSVVKLRSLRCLRTLTLHGNPVEATRGYRVQVVHTLPQLRSLDFAPVVKRERKAPVPGGRACPCVFGGPCGSCSTYGNCGSCGGCGPCGSYPRGPCGQCVPCRTR